MKSFLTYSFCILLSLTYYIPASAQSLDSLNKRVAALETNSLTIADLNRLREEYDKKLNEAKADLNRLREEYDKKLNEANALAGVPVGSIVPFYGNPNHLPDNWRLCNGNLLVSKPNSPFNNQSLPNMVGKFLQGVDSRNKLGDTGGISYIGGHSHSITGSAYDINFGIESIDGYIGGYNPVKGVSWYMTEGHSVTIRYDDTLINLATQEGTKKGHGHKGGKGSVSGSTSYVDGHDNRPPFICVYYIIRIY